MMQELYFYSDNLASPGLGGCFVKAGTSERTVLNEPPQFQVPRSLKGTPEALVIEWPDGITHRLSWRLLRDRCPCATCRTKTEKPPEAAGLLTVLSPREAQPLKVAGMRPVGNYAYAIEFNDGHNSGIFSWEYLYFLGSQQAALWQQYEQRLAAAGMTRDAVSVPAVAAAGGACGHHH